MGARQSRRSVDITTTPKKEGIPAEGGGVVGDAAAPGDGKLERIEESDTKPTTNGIAPHTDVTEDKEKDKDDATEKEEKEKEKDKEQQPEEVKAEEAKAESAGESPAENAEVTTPTEATPASPNTATSPDSKETKKKDKPKKKWSFRSISFSKKDKSKPAREEAPKNGDITKEEPLTEGGEEAENGSPTAGSPVEEQSAVSSPSAENEAAPATPATATAAATVAAAAPSEETKEEAAPPAASSPVDEKKEEPTPSAPTPVPVEEKKEEVEKVEAEKKVVEVSPAGGQSIADPVEVSVFRVQPVATPSIIERKTSEDIPSLPPSSPPPTPIDPSPLQQAQQVAASATALAEALKLPAEAADKELTAPSTTLSSSCQEPNDPPKQPTESLDVSSRLPSSSTDEPPAEATPVPAKVEALPVVDKDTDSSYPAAKENLGSSKSDESEKVTGIEAPSIVDSAAKCRAEAPAEERVVSLAESGDRKNDPNETRSLVAESEAKEPHDREEFKNETLPVVRDETSDTRKSREIKVDEKPEVLADIVIPEKVESIEKPLESDVLRDAISVSPEENKIPDIVSETVVPEELVENVATKAEKLTDPEIVVEPVEKLIEPAIDPETEFVQEKIEEKEAIREEIIVEQIESKLLSDPTEIDEEILVEATPAIVIPEDEPEDTLNTDACVSTTGVESIEIAEIIQDDIPETEMKSDTALPTEEIPVVVEEIEELLVPDDLKIETIEPINATDAVTENVVEEKKDVTEIAEIVESMPPPLPKSPVPCPQGKSDLQNIPIEIEPNLVLPPTIDLKSSFPEVEKTEDLVDFSLPDTSIPPQNLASRVSESPISDIKDKDPSLENESQTPHSPSRVENILIPSGDLPSAPQDTAQHADSSEYPLPPPDELSCPLIPSNVSEIKSELPVSVENVSSLRNPTETLLTPPRSPSPQSNVSTASGVTTSTKDSSQTQLYDDQSNREFKMESVSISLNSYNDSDIELRERLAESLAETVNQEETFSCQLSNTTSTAVQDTHQSTPESEAPVENKVAHEVSTTESLDDAPKVAPPAVPTEVPASPPSAPAITEDVASVTKAIEEIDISDKAVAAATIECNTNEIIADAHHQNKINE